MNRIMSLSVRRSLKLTKYLLLNCRVHFLLLPSICHFQKINMYLTVSIVCRKSRVILWTELSFQCFRRRLFNLAEQSSAAHSIGTPNPKNPFYWVIQWPLGFGMCDLVTQRPYMLLILGYKWCHHSQTQGSNHSPVYLFFAQNPLSTLFVTFLDRGRNRYV